MYSVGLLILVSLHTVWELDSFPSCLLSSSLYFPHGNIASFHQLTIWPRNILLLVEKKRGVGGREESTAIHVQNYLAGVL